MILWQTSNIYTNMGVAGFDGNVQPINDYAMGDILHLNEYQKQTQTKTSLAKILGISLIK